MSYVLETCIAGDTIEISKYYNSYNRPKGMPRGKRIKETTEQQFKCNERRAEKTLRRLINANFGGGDYHINLNYKKECRPADKKEMRENVRKFLRNLRKEYKKHGKVLKYIHVMEIGKKGARHHHLVINRLDAEVIRKAWDKGRVHIYPLDDTGQYAQLASYLIKYSSAVLKSENALQGKRWDSSRNLKKPLVKKRIISRNKFREQPQEKKGYYIDKNSIRNYTSDITGYQFMGYTLVKIKQRE